VKTILSLFILLATAAFCASAAEQTWAGQISDSMCGAHHGMKLSPHDCTVACVKHGAKYVFVHAGKVYNIANQDFAGLEKNAGYPIKLTGDLSGDTITVAKIAMAGKTS
jgi:hypothetical protein